MVYKVCNNLNKDMINGWSCTIHGNCPNLYNDVRCPIKHLLYNCCHLNMDFAEGQQEPMSFHCEHPDVLKEDWVCPVKGDRSVKCPLRASF